MSYEEEKKLTDEAKVGDKWYVCFGFRGESIKKVEVIKVVKTQITFSNGATIMKRTRRPIGAGRWDTTSYHPATEGLIKEFEEQILANQARQKLDSELDRLAVALREHKLSTEQQLALAKSIREVFPKEDKE